VIASANQGPIAGPIVGRWDDHVHQTVIVRMLFMAGSLSGVLGRHEAANPFHLI